MKSDAVSEGFCWLLPGNRSHAASVIPPVAAGALPGLQVRHRLRSGSPERCAASPPGSRAHRGPALPGQPQLLQVTVQL
ncbi:hypothetical protein GJ746_20120 [Klebsiella oxytoca]|uniref:Uncharacterized protein n=1 Tax=Klebsiella oxytoca TaxID=571 RepID=A0A6B8MXD2_KLEOX|nr:hypothetical protein GJ746_20120 [Klebsiella oxytoca]